MIALDSFLPAQPFFLHADKGDLFCLYHPPNGQRPPSEHLIYIHPFGDEMNKSRRMAALQARRFAALGIGVLQVDLFGCGDSSGEFGDARWDIWAANLTCARNWLEERSDAPIGLWGLRLGGLLALDFAHACRDRFSRIILWQPVINGETHLGQFLRMKLANEMINGSNGKTTTLQDIRSALAAGETVEVAGYELSSSLAGSIDSLKAERFAITNCPLHWFELASGGNQTLSVPSARVVEAWEKKGVDINLRLVNGSAFWSSQEITTCPELLSATSEIHSETIHE